MKTSPSLRLPQARRKNGFTLVEMLVSMTVLSLIMVVLSQLLNATVLATTTSQKQIEATRQSRAVLDTMRQDLASLVTENGASTVFAKTDGLNSQLVFVTYRRGPQGMTAPRFTAISYTLDGAKMQISRNYSQIAWNATDLMTAALSPASSVSNVVSEGTLRFEVVLLLDNGSVVSLSDAGSWIDTTWNGDAVPNGFSALRLAGATIDASKPRVRALTVAVASVDKGSLLLPNVGNIPTALVSPASGKTPLEAWVSIIDQGGLANAPRPAVAALRVLQLTFPVQ